MGSRDILDPNGGLQADFFFLETELWFTQAVGRIRRLQIIGGLTECIHGT